MKHECPFCRCGGDAPEYPVECSKCHVLYGPGYYPGTHNESTCDGVSFVDVLKTGGARFADQKRQKEAS